MSVIDVESRAFVPGTTGWSAADLDDPEVERLWCAGNYEIVEGVLTQMPPAFFAGGEGLFNLVSIVREHVKLLGIKARFAGEVDIVVGPRRVVRADAAMLMPADAELQRAAARKAGKIDVRRARLYVPPTLAVESVSPGHEEHDRETKRLWYAEFGVPHYWILNSFDRELACLQLQGGVYVDGGKGRGSDEIRPSLFAGLSIPLAELWGDD